MGEAFGFAKVVELSPGGKEGFLGGIFAGGKIAEDAKGDPADHGLVAGDDLDESAFIAAAGGVDQFGIGGAVFAVGLSRADHIAFI
jgi:hypothetical protein